MALSAGVALAIAGCGGAADRPESGVRAVTTVLESTGSVGVAHGPQLCLGSVQESQPPQCGGPDIVGWDWDTVDGDTTVAGTTWGDYVVEGTFDGTRLTLTSPPRPATADDHPDIGPQTGFSTPCTEPAAGWTPRMPGDAQDDLLDDAATRYLRDDEISAVWLSQTATQLIWNVRVTREPLRHRQALAPVMPHNLCVTEGGRSRNELEAIARTEMAAIPPDNRLGGGAFEIPGTVEIDVVLDRDGTMQRALDAKHGPGLVHVRSALRPVS